MKLSILSFILTLHLPVLTTGFAIPHNRCSSHASISFETRRTTLLNANLITFDLDDTLFPVGPVVQDANTALISHLNDLGYPDITQESLIGSTKSIRTELSKNDKVITYTELRKRAIYQEICKPGANEFPIVIDENGDAKESTLYSDNEEMKSLVEEAYNIWEENRHLAAERHLYHDTIIMLQNLRNDFPMVTIGAITNGKGNPLMMKKTVSQYFDFCVSGEDDDVFPNRKPHQGIYKKTLEYYREMKSITDDCKEQEECFCWVHVGDDLANDVGASANAGALAIWADLSEEYDQSTPNQFKDGSKTENSNDGQQQPFWSTASQEEIEKRKMLNDNSLKFVSARIEKLCDLSEAITNVIAKKIVK